MGNRIARSCLLYIRFPRENGTVLQRYSVTTVQCYSSTVFQRAVAKLHSILPVTVPCEATIFKGGGVPGDSEMHTVYKVRIIENNDRAG